MTMSLLLKPSVPYVPNRCDLWDAHVPPLVIVPPAEGEIPAPTLYSQTVTMGFSAYFSKDAFVSDYYAALTGDAPPAVGTLDSVGDIIILQAVAHAPTSNRFDCFTLMPIKSFKANGLLIDETYLTILVPGFFYFNVQNVGGYEALYNLVSGDVLSFTEITPYGGI